jgi:GH25 family lysozyme M1 (1,4-beta-N-acetylmuramidase)
METITTRAHGIDVSKYDISFKPANATKQLDFVIQRASYGQVKDEAFDTLYPGVALMPVRMAYHYLNSGVSVATQVDKFLSVVGSKGFHAYACDFEEYYNTMSVDFAKMAWDFMKEVAVRTGKRVLLYTNPNNYDTYIYPSQAKFGINWSLADLWLAQWYNTPQPNGTPSMPTHRTAGWSFWQYFNSKTDGAKYGIGRTTVDLNVFNGTVSDMKNWLGIGETTPPTTVYPKASFSLTVDGVVYEANDVELKPKP